MEQTSVLQFSIEELIYFRTGLEASELLSISLEPDISIEERNGYVTIKGVLELSGEYILSEKEQGENDSFPEYGVRFIQQLEAREDGIAEFTHQLPVDITIPKKRISNLEEVFVAIESFDYDFPQENCLKLLADLSIYGVMGQEKEAPAHEMDEVRQEEEMTFTRQDEMQEEEMTFTRQDEMQEEEMTFSRQDEINEEKMVEEKEEPLASETEMVRKEEQSMEEEEQQEEHDIDEEENENDADIVFAEPLKRDEEEEDDYNTITIEAKQDHHVKTAEQADERAEETENEHEDVQLEEESDIQKEEHARKNDNALYLTKLFAKEGEEEFSRLKIYIVQQGDSLENICQRYNITVQQLGRINNFSYDQEVKEGDLIYIPAEKQKA